MSHPRAGPDRPRDAGAGRRDADARRRGRQVRAGRASCPGRSRPPSSRVAIGAVDGALSSDATIRDVAVSDRDGVWLKLDRARIVWRRLALLSGRLEVDSLEIGRLDVLRRPIPGPTPPEAKPDGKLLPDLPVKVEIKGFTLAELVLANRSLGSPRGCPRRGGRGSARRARGSTCRRRRSASTRRGASCSHSSTCPTGDRLELKANLIEPAGGLLSKAANIPGTPPIDFDLDGTGTLDAWNAKLDFAAGPEIGAKGGAKISRIGAERRLALDLAARIEGLVPGPAASVFAGTTKLDGGLAFADSGAFRIDRLELTSRTARLAAGGSLTKDRVADLTLQARALPNDGAVTRGRRGRDRQARVRRQPEGSADRADGAGQPRRGRPAQPGFRARPDRGASRRRASGRRLGARLRDHWRTARSRACGWPIRPCAGPWGAGRQFTLRAASGPDGVIDVVGAPARFRDGPGALCRPRRPEHADRHPRCGAAGPRGVLRPRRARPRREPRCQGAPRRRPGPQGRRGRPHRDHRRAGHRHRGRRQGPRPRAHPAGAGLADPTTATASTTCAWRVRALPRPCRARRPRPPPKSLGASSSRASRISTAA